MVRTHSWLFLTLSVSLITSCASDPSSCDPRNPGFISGISAMASGCYEKRVSDRRDAVAAEQSYSSSLSAEKKQLSAQKRMSSKQKAQAQNKLAALQSRNNELQAKLQQIDTNSADATAEKARLENQLAQAKKDTAVLNRKIESDSISERDLNQQVEKMTKDRDDMAAALGNSQVF